MVKINRCRSVMLCAFLAGCATAEFVPYVGQQRDWPTSPGSMRQETSYVPIYYGLPERPYELLGQISASVAPIRETGILKYAAHCAKDRGADAIIVLERERELSGFYNTGYSQNGWSSGGSSASYGGRANVLLIKFKDSQRNNH